MKPSPAAIDLLALCAIKAIDWHVVARESQRPGGVPRLVDGDVVEDSRAAIEASRLIRADRANHEVRREWVLGQVERARAAGAGLVSVLDDDYPPNLRLVFNLPPFLFYRGKLTRDDTWSVAVVGTREASAEGIQHATEIAGALTSAGVTVVSGLAKGIDTAAHTSALRSGGRTVAVIGTGVLRCYPRENGRLAEKIAATGAIVSQFWPDSGPTRASFPMRNVTMSGISQGTVVVEASSTSGAKMQARLAIEHGKRVFLSRSLVTRQKWARDYLQRGAVEIGSAADVLHWLRSTDRIEELSSQRRQLAMELV